MEIILIGSFCIGGALGCLLPMSKDILISAGMLIINVFNLNNYLFVLFLSGYFCTAFISIMMENLVKVHSQQLDKSKEEIFNFCVSYMLSFISVFMIAVILFQVFNSSLFSITIIMLLSFFKLFYDIIDYVYKRNQQKGLIRRIIGLIIISILAGLTINNENSNWAINGYFTTFLCLTHLNPSKKEQSIEQKFSLLDSLRFGGSFVNHDNGISSATYYAVILAQSIIWGSEKDSLGMLLNIAFPAQFDSFRFTWAILISIVTYIAMYIAIKREMNSVNLFYISIDNKIESIIKYILVGINFYLLYINLGIIILILAILGKFSLSMLGYYPLLQFSVPMLIIASILS